MTGLAIVLLFTLLGCFAMDTYRWLRKIDRRLDAIEHHLWEKFGELP